MNFNPVRLICHAANSAVCRGRRAPFGPPVLLSPFALREAFKTIGIQWAPFPVSMGRTGARPAAGEGGCKYAPPDHFYLGWVGRTTIPGHPFPTTGNRNPTRTSFHGGNYAIPHLSSTATPCSKETRAPDHGGVDIVAAVLPAAKQRGLEGVLFD